MILAVTEAEALIFGLMFVSGHGVVCLIGYRAGQLWSDSSRRVRRNGLISLTLTFLCLAPILILDSLQRPPAPRAIALPYGSELLLGFFATACWGVFVYMAGMEAGAKSQERSAPSKKPGKTSGETAISNDPSSSHPL